MKVNKILFLLPAALILLSSCQTDTYIRVHKKVPFPEPKSYYTFWLNESQWEKEDIVSNIDESITSDRNIPSTLKAEWINLSFTRKDEYIEDFFFRREKRLLCSSFSNTPYKKYLKYDFTRNFKKEFLRIISLSPKFKYDSSQSPDYLYSKDMEEAEGSFQETQRKVPRERIRYEEDSYEKLSNESGLTKDPDKESLIKDITTVLDE